MVNPPEQEAHSHLNQYDVIWTTPSADSRGSMPLGNGEVGINAWVELNGDLQFYISRSDSYSEVSRLLKAGLVRVNISPNPFNEDASFSQKLHLRDGVIEITGGRAGEQCRICLFVDSDEPVVHCNATSEIPVDVQVKVESWRTTPRTLTPEEMDSAWTMKSAPFPLVESADSFTIVGPESVAWYHRNQTSCVKSTLDLQGLESAASICDDPLLHRTFGGLVTAMGFVASDDRTLQSSEPIKQFSIRVAAPCLQTSAADEWINLAWRAATSSDNPTVASERTKRWWHKYWDSAWVNIKSGDADSAHKVITQGYVLQRFMQACGGRGTYPIKFNGGVFTVSPSGAQDDADWRRWGDCHWWQNVRLMYYPMLASGDFDMMAPVFKLYQSAIPIGEARSRLAENVEGCYFPETMTVWGTYANSDFGWDREGLDKYFVNCPWWGKTRNQGPEIVALMLDYWDFTQDRDFLQTTLLPMAVSVLTYFDQRYARNEHGKLVIDPTQSVETYWTGVVDDTPTIAGLQNMCERLHALVPRLKSTEQAGLFKLMLDACPEIPTETNAKTNKVQIAPARLYDPKRDNCENPETYAIWPFGQYGLTKPDLQMARDTYDARFSPLPVGWGYDANCAAVLGLADEAAKLLLEKCNNSNVDYRWPATWGPNFDWVPDQNHGGNLLNTTQLMLIQSVGSKILLFPAWPKDWDVDFKLRAAFNTTVEATLCRGEITRLVVTPQSRLDDVIRCLDPEVSPEARSAA